MVDLLTSTIEIPAWAYWLPVAYCALGVAIEIIKLFNLKK